MKSLGLSLLLGSTSGLPLFSRVRAGCNGVSTPGEPNLNPINSDAPVFVKEVKNGKLFTMGGKDDQISLLHVWGTPYEWGQAQAQLAGPQMRKFLDEVYSYAEDQVIDGAANNTWLAWIAKTGLDVALGLSYEVTKPYIGDYVMQEIQGISDVLGVPVNDIRNVIWLGELTRGACSMFGAWGEATKSRGGDLLQLRALDWDVDGPFKNYPAIVVYHPSSPQYGHAWANVGFLSFTGSITGMSSSRLSISEIGVTYPDETFGPETYLAPGYPFVFILRDILQFDNSLNEATQRIKNATRTCDLLLGVGDGNGNNFTGFQYSPQVANAFTDTDLQPTKDWHPRVKDVVYWGMDWLCPNDNSMLSHQLSLLHGNITVENTIRDIMSYVGTGDVHVAVYDHADYAMYVAVARQDGGVGPLEAYKRQFTKVDLRALWAEPAPTVAVTSVSA